MVQEVQVDAKRAQKTAVLAEAPNSGLEKKKVVSYGSIGATTASSVAAAVPIVPVVCLCILGVELCERLAFYTFVGTQEFFLEQLGYTLSEAGGINAAMGTLCMGWALFAGWVADVGLGRYLTILVFGILYAAGAIVAAMGAWPSRESSRTYLVGVMVLLPLGTAGIKANISNFGADQYDTSDPAQKAAQEKFFSWFYLAINMGSAVAYGYLTTMGSNGGLGVPKMYGYFAVYSIAALCMLLAVALFRSARLRYRVQPILPRSSLGCVSAYVMASARKGSSVASMFVVGVILLAAGVVFSVIQAILPHASFAGYLTGSAFACSAVGVAAVLYACKDTTWVVDVPSEALPAADVKAFLRLLPVLFVANLAFSSLYNSMQFWYQQQACQMDLRIPFAANGAQFSGSFFMIADCLGIVLATPIAVDWLNPVLESRLGAGFGHGAKFGLGMAFAALSVLGAAHLEMHRRMVPVFGVASNCAPDGVKMSALGAGWMTVPFFLMGLGEIYTQPVLMHFAYTNSPASMRTLAAATGLVFGAVSSALFTVQEAILAPYVPNDLNAGHLEYGYLSNLVLAGILYVVYVHTLRNFESADLHEKQ
mmetsp:Transcript_59132/g.114096  ORF Transcript_59132/g.114096 Transcript_59132/m.114096 type:complete len:594 (+) Transcript_59132:67-1848(+)